MQFMGEGGETHCEILKDFMILYGEMKSLLLCSVNNLKKSGENCSQFY